MDINMTRTLWLETDDTKVMYLLAVILVSSVLDFANGMGKRKV